MKTQHEKELEDQREEYGKLLREESSKWELQREELENEMMKLKKLSASTPTLTSNPVMMTRGQSSKSQEADLTAIIKDLKESSELLSSNGKKRSSSSIGRNNNTGNNSYMNTSNVRETMPLPNLVKFLFLETTSSK